MAEFVKVAKTSEIEDQTATCAELRPHTTPICPPARHLHPRDHPRPHEEGPLSEGFVDGFDVECPWHAACFNLKTGKASGPPAEDDVKTYPVRVVGDDVEVEV